MKNLGEIENYCKQYYNNNNRYYHNWKHIDYILQVFNYLKKNKYLLMSNEREQAYIIAIYFHDLVYDPYQKDNLNIRQSIELFKKYAKNKNLDNDRIITLIEATDYSIPLQSKTTEQRIMTDLDLSILASKVDIYTAYTANIKKEYKDYSEYDYTVGRRKLMCQLYELANQNKLFIVLPEFNKKALYNISQELEGLKI
jgi:predicted metal-dependent HD superfamily phosphohydrolase